MQVVTKGGKESYFVCLELFHFAELSKKALCIIEVKNSFLLFIFVLKYISEPVLSYFYLSKGVELVLLLLPESIFTQVSVLLLK